jgi:hypothetical protein
MAVSETMILPAIRADFKRPLQISVRRDLAVIGPFGKKRFAAARKS